MTPHETRRDRSRPQRKCIGFSEALELQRQKKAARIGPQPWIVQKFAVGLVVCLVGYTIYVYVVRFCVPMIGKEARSMGGRVIGIVFLVVFSVLFLMFSWSYLKAVLTPPGYAKDHVSKSPPPIAQPQPAYHPGSVSSDDSLRGTPYRSPTPSRSRRRPSLDIASPPRPPVPSLSPPHSRRNTHDANLGMIQVRPSPHAQGGETRSLDAGSPARTSKHKSAPRRPPPALVAQRGVGGDSGLPSPLYSRRPPTHPTLSPEYRYCSRDGFLKPMRAHHCRACGTCVLKYDHHCPWIGQCVGAFNHKFFVNFLQWSTFFTGFIFASLVALNVRAASSTLISASIDPQQIAIIALSGIFTIFTLTLFISHVHLILSNMSTVEHLDMQRMRERERSVLSQMTKYPLSCSPRPRHLPETYGLPDGGGRSPFRFITLRRRIVKQWDAEWGEIGTEANIWWLGSRHANWEATMGKAKLGWILPVGRSIGDGLSYPINPRFDRDGRWRRRAEWPEGLR